MLTFPDSHPHSYDSCCYHRNVLSLRHFLSLLFNHKNEQWRDILVVLDWLVLSSTQS